MRIGVIGTGKMGRALGLRWTQCGHAVLFGSGDPAKARAVASNAGPGSTRVGSFDDAASFGEVVLYTVRDVLPSQLLREPKSLFGKVVIDCSNSAILGLEVPDPELRRGVHFSTAATSRAERLATDIPGAKVVKAFNTVPVQVIELDRQTLWPHRISVFLCADDQRAKATVTDLVETLGFVPVDSGDLERARLVEAVADFVRFQITGMERGPLATLSLNVLQTARR